MLNLVLVASGPDLATIRDHLREVIREIEIGIVNARCGNDYDWQICHGPMIELSDLVDAGIIADDPERRVAFDDVDPR